MVLPDEMEEVPATTGKEEIRSVTAKHGHVPGSDVTKPMLSDSRTGANQFTCLLSACYVLNIVQGTWDTSENKTRSPALVERTVYHVSPLHLCTACDPGQVTAPFCPMG